MKLKHNYFPAVFLLSVTLLWSGSLSLFGQTFTAMSSSEIFKQKLKTYSDNATTLKSNFTQEKYMSILEDKVTSKGLFYFKKENKIRWEITSPNPYTVVIDETQVTIRDKDNVVKTYDMNSNKMFAQINEIFSGCLKGSIADNTDKYQLSYFESATSYLVKLVPKDKKIKDFVTEMQIQFNSTKMNVETIKIIEPGGDYTLIKFSGLVENGTLSDSLFQF